MTNSSSSSAKPVKPGESDDLAFFMGEKCSVEGAVLEVDGAARIDGQFSGKLRAVHLIVGEKGHVAGDISSETADIMGTVEDTLVLSGKLTIREAGRIEGTITYGSLEAHEGAQLVGQINTQVRSTRTEGTSSLSNLRSAISQSARDTGAAPKPADIGPADEDSDSES
ncbi:MAG: polymer-forming cytoskeletal protein [Oceanicaulis sp.]|uniref:bactofilin family protein n=1 Tax=Glycocaulis sp. TaxID=1969725 RepID=UPI0025B9FC51|nr:polymer-forming cytoskeletal protein [Glycocaulis sp.]MCC5981535.1 polymer-forming cytoskeletal protein [Oceanicaulis sp.]MCH8520765.1 polymer-forming cytoskeletal protein [Glycocaulis sp.]